MFRIFYVTILNAYSVITVLILFSVKFSQLYFPTSFLKFQFYIVNIQNISAISFSKHSIFFYSILFFFLIIFIVSCQSPYGIQHPILNPVSLSILNKGLFLSFLFPIFVLSVRFRVSLHVNIGDLGCCDLRKTFVYGDKVCFALGGLDCGYRWREM